jgi:uncharacterized membrane protein YphA (DoxX/SURF4 family)
VTTLSNRERKWALTALRWSLGIIILIEAVLFLFSPISRHAFESTQLPGSLRLVLGWGEILASILLAIQGTVAIGGRLLMLIFAIAIVIHLLHGMPNVGSLVIYFTSAWVVTTGESAA